MSFKKCKDPEKRRAAVTAYNRAYYRQTALYERRYWTEAEIDMLFNNQMTDRELSSIIKRSMKSIVNKRSEIKKQMRKHQMDLRDFLEAFDFEYVINNDKTISLVDIAEVNLGDIESECFDNTAEIVERLRGYIYDYETEGIDYLLKKHNVPIDLNTASLKDKVRAAKVHQIYVYDIYFCILMPELICVKEWDSRSSNYHLHAA